MRVDRNQSASPICRATEDYQTGNWNRREIEGGVPLRLEIASRIIPMMARVQFNQYSQRFEFDRAAARDALVMADALIEEHNNTCGEKT